MSHRIIQILVVDDHPLVRRGLVSSLADNEWIVCGEAENGKDAVLQFATLKPDLILMDVSMPVMNGIEALREIRKLSRAVKIVMLSMHDSLQIREQASIAGADAYASKTASLEDLRRTIRDVLP